MPADSKYILRYIEKHSQILSGDNFHLSPHGLLMFLARDGMGGGWCNEVRAERCRGKIQVDSMTKVGFDESDFFEDVDEAAQFFLAKCEERYRRNQDGRP